MINFVGRKSFTWFIGVVEDRNDPVQLGRVRVRCFGWHTDKKDQIPTSALPWAVVINSTDSGSISGLGTTPPGLLEGSWVLGFFLDGDTGQEPAILGSITGIPDALPNTQLGFNDPQGNFPRYINESDVNKLARGINTITYTPDSSIEEPASPFNAKYPFNHVTETESGHIKEYDDTPGAERIRESHRSGSLYEIHPNGDKVVRVVGKKYAIVAGDESVHIGGEVKVIIDGNVDVKIGGTCTIESAGNMTFKAPRIDINPSGATSVSFNSDFADTPVPYAPNIISISPDEVPPEHPTNPEQVDIIITPTGDSVKPTYEQVSTKTCNELEHLNPYDIAFDALGGGDGVWKETGSNPAITALWDEIGYNGKQYADKTAWCAVFVGAVLKRSGNKYIKTASSQAYASYGKEVNINDVQRGDLLVFYRKGPSSGLGHVGFATGRRTATTIDCLGGNQGDSLNIRSFQLRNDQKEWALRTIRRAVSCKDGTTEAPSSKVATDVSASGSGGSVT
jgi:uncharacterized protein (TIGR02594 family)